MPEPETTRAAFSDLIRLIIAAVHAHGFATDPAQVERLNAGAARLVALREQATPEEFSAAMDLAIERFERQTAGGTIHERYAAAHRRIRDAEDDLIAARGTLRTLRNECCADCGGPYEMHPEVCSGDRPCSCGTCMRSEKKCRAFLEWKKGA